jgi:hypothetical protein
MEKLRIEDRSLLRKCEEVGKFITHDAWWIDQEVGRVFDCVHDAARKVAVVLAGISLVAIMFVWADMVDARHSWPSFGWWFVALLGFSLVAFFTSYLLDKTPLLQEQERARLKQESAADLKLIAARVIVEAVSVWETVCRQYHSVYRVVNGSLDHRGEEEAARCHAFLVESYQWIERDIEYFLLKDEIAPLESPDQLPAGDPGYLAHPDKLRQIIGEGKASDFGRHLVHAVPRAPVIAAAFASVPA